MGLHGIHDAGPFGEINVRILFGGFVFYLWITIISVRGRMHYLKKVSLYGLFILLCINLHLYAFTENLRNVWVDNS